MRLSLMNLKTLCLTKKYSDTKWTEFKAKNIDLEHTKSTKYHYRVDDERFVLDDRIHTLACFHKDLKNRFSQMIKNKKDSKRFS